MKSNESASNQQNTGNVQSRQSPYEYRKVLDGRKQPIRGLWERNGKFIARLSVEDQNGEKRVQWVVLEGAQTVPQAQEKFKALHVDRARNALPVLKRAPTFAAYADEYFLRLAQTPDAKRPATVQKERGAISLWVDHMGGIRLDKIRRIHVNMFIEKRQSSGMSGRTVNLDVIALRNVLKRAIDDEWLKVLPTENLRPLKWTPKTRSLVSQADIDRLCETAMEVSKNGHEFAEYLRLMAYSGARRNEALRLKWSDVNWQQAQLTIGSDGLNKGREVRRVDFNANLERQLREMSARRAPDSDFLFPSPQRGDRDVSAKTFRETLSLTRKKAVLKSFTFHNCRHFFISYSVMSGVDFMTIAKWVGHKDGGVLIGKVYGHLADAHTKQQAQKISFGPAIVTLPQAAIA
jgi:integrase